MPISSSLPVLPSETLPERLEAEGWSVSLSGTPATGTQLARGASAYRWYAVLERPRGAGRWERAEGEGAEPDEALQAAWEQTRSFFPLLRTRFDGPDRQAMPERKPRPGVRKTIPAGDLRKCLAWVRDVSPQEVPEDAPVTQTDLERLHMLASQEFCGYHAPDMVSYDCIRNPQAICFCVAYVTLRLAFAGE